MPNDSDGQADAFVYDRGTGTVTLVSEGIDGMAAGIDSDTAPIISPDGRYVAFSSTSGDAAPGFTNFFGVDELYLRDLATGTTTMVSTAPDGTTPGDRSSDTPTWSADSHSLVFASLSDNLVSAFTGVRESNLFETTSPHHQGNLHKFIRH